MELENIQIASVAFFSFVAIGFLACLVGDIKCNI